MFLTQNFLYFSCKNFLFQNPQKMSIFFKTHKKCQFSSKHIKKLPISSKIRKNFPIFSAKISISSNPAKISISFQTPQKTDLCKSNHLRPSKSACILDARRRSMAREVIHFL